MTLKLTSSRKYPGMPTVGSDLESHTRVLEALRDAVQIHERRTADVRSSFVRVQDLIDLGFVRLEGSNLLVPVGFGSAGSDDQTAAEVPYDNSDSGLTAKNVQDAIDELSLSSGSSASLETEIMADAPSLYWKLNEASGNFADSSGNGVTLTASGTIHYRASALLLSEPSTRYALFTSGAGAQVAGAAGLTTPLTNDWTITAVGAIGGGGATAFFGMGNTGETEATNFQAMLYQNGSQILSAFWETGSGTNVELQVSILPRLVPIHIAAVKDSSASIVDFYINGAKVHRASYVSEPTGGSSVVTGVGQITGQNSGPVALAHVAFFYGRALSADRIAAHARAAGFRR